MKTLEKTIVYRVYSISLGFILFYLITGEMVKATKLAVTIELFKLVQYYIFEKFWNKLKKYADKNTT